MPSSHTQHHLNAGIQGDSHKRAPAVSAQLLPFPPVGHGNSQIHTSAKKWQVIKSSGLPTQDSLATENQCCQL